MSTSPSSGPAARSFPFVKICVCGHAASSHALCRCPDPSHSPTNCLASLCDCRKYRQSPEAAAAEGVTARAQATTSELLVAFTAMEARLQKMLADVEASRLRRSKPEAALADLEMRVEVARACAETWRHSERCASYEKPAGLESGAALREMNDLVDPDFGCNCGLAAFRRGSW